MGDGFAAVVGCGAAAVVTSVWSGVGGALGIACAGCGEATVAGGGEGLAEAALGGPALRRATKPMAPTARPPARTTAIANLRRRTGGRGASTRLSEVISVSANAVARR